VLHRLMVSGADRHGHAWRAGYRVPGAEAISLRQLYKAPSWPAGHDTSGDGSAASCG